MWGVVWSTPISFTVPLTAERTNAPWLCWIVVGVIRLVCAAPAVDPLVQYGGAIYAGKLGPDDDFVHDLRE